jgi:hypothetical protein
LTPENSRRGVKFVKFVLFLLLFVAAQKFCQARTGGFTLSTIDTDIPYDASWEVPPSPLPPLNRPFSFLGKGGQSYVFLSEDRSIVLKFFKKPHGLSDDLIAGIEQILPNSLRPYRAQFLQKRLERFRTIFESCRLAYTHLRRETGLLYLHLNPTLHECGTVTLIDRLGISHTVDLDATSFLVQKRGQLLCRRLTSHLREGNLEGARTSIASLLHYLKKRSEAGIRDTDNALKRNYGFMDDTAVSIDVGSFLIDPTLQEPAALHQDLVRKTRQLRRWMIKRHPELVSIFDEEVQKIDPLLYSSPK